MGDQARRERRSRSLLLAGTLATGLVLFAATRWRSLQPLPPALWVLATTLLIATLIHTERFKWDCPPRTRGWSSPPACRRARSDGLQREVAEPEPPAGPGLRVVRVLSAVLGAVLVVGAAALFVAPVEVGEKWPWPLTAARKGGREVVR